MKHFLVRNKNERVILNIQHKQLISRTEAKILSLVSGSEVHVYQFLAFRAKQRHVSFAFGRQLCLAVQCATKIKLITQNSVCYRCTNLHTYLLILKQWIKCFSTNILQSLKGGRKIICYQNAAQNSSGNLSGIQKLLNSNSFVKFSNLPWDLNISSVLCQQFLKHSAFKNKTFC